MYDVGFNLVVMSIVIVAAVLQIFADLSDTFSVRKMQLLGSQRPLQDL